MVSSAASSGDLVSRIGRVLRLDRAVFNEVEADTTATGQAWTVVILATLSTALGGFLRELVAGGGVGRPILGLVSGLIIGLVGFLIWAFVVYFVGTRFFGGRADYAEMIRTLGFAYSPNIFSIVAAVPVIGGLLALLVSLWGIVAGFLAVREGLDLDTTKAILTIIISVVVLFLFTVIVTAVLATLGAIVGLATAP
ncbi:MAG: hypothetical protein KatS3mg061_3032 [Dehalococcoidia bacterium]|nr:MAG: hypothetical protein KatS3mg061_3032 [Dehalococcoidia bacterium]